MEEEQPVFRATRPIRQGPKPQEPRRAPRPTRERAHAPRQQRLDPEPCFTHRTYGRAKHEKHSIQEVPVPKDDWAAEEPPAARLHLLVQLAQASDVGGRRQRNDPECDREVARNDQCGLLQGKRWNRSH